MIIVSNIEGQLIIGESSWTGNEKDPKITIGNEQLDVDKDQNERLFVPRGKMIKHKYSTIAYDNQIII